MGCALQIHEKIDKRGIWAYHSVNGWYLETFPEHYRTHLCHVKATRSERFTDTAQVNHKSITRLTITHTNKVMSAIADFAKAIKNMGNNNEFDKIRQLLQLTEAAVQ